MMNQLYNKFNNFFINNELSRQQLKEIFVTAVVYLTIDIVYINSKKDYFGEFFKSVQGKPLVFRKSAAFIVYILLVTGLYYFVIKDRKSIIYAFLLGLFVYGVYDLTNYATLTNWTAEFVFKDTLWGGIVFALSTFIIYEIIKRI